MHAALGRAATYTPPGGGSPVSCTVMVTAGGENAPGNLPVIASGRTVIAFLAAEVPNPKRDGTILVGATTYIVDAPLEQDRRFFVRVTVK